MGGRGRGGAHHDDRGLPRGGPRRRGIEPVSFREFTMSLDDTVGVEEAGHRYKQYLSEFWGGAVKAEFEDRRVEPAVRQRSRPAPTRTS